MLTRAWLALAGDDVERDCWLDVGGVAVKTVLRLVYARGISSDERVAATDTRRIGAARRD